MLFPDKDLDFSNLSEIYYTSSKVSMLSEEEDSSRYKLINRNYAADQDLYLERAKSLTEINQNELYFQSINKEKNLTKSFKVSTEKQTKIGIKAEHFFSCWLKTKLGDSYSEYKNWVSSARNTVFPSNSAQYNDSLGYDFMIDDYLNIFKTNDTKIKKCFIEVKGTEEKFDGTFHLSSNEKKCRDDKATNITNETYLIVIIENVYDPKLIRIAGIINWTTKKEAIKLCEETYLATLSSEYNTHENNMNNIPNPKSFNKNYFRNQNNNQSQGGQNSFRNQNNNNFGQSNQNYYKNQYNAN